MIHKTRFYIFISIIGLIGNAKISCINGADVSSIVKSVGQRVLQDLKRDIVPAKIKQCWGAATDSNRYRITRGLALYDLAMAIGFSYIPALTEFSQKRALKVRQLEPVSEYDNPNYPGLAQMTRDMGLDPEHVYVGECDTKQIMRETAAATRTWTKNILLIDRPQQDAAPEPKEDKAHADKEEQLHLDDAERHFMAGHELSHIKNQHVFKRIGLSLIAPWITRAGLIVGNTLTQTGLAAIAKKFNLKDNRFMNVIKRVSQFVLRNPFMEMLYTNRLLTYYGRCHEKQADTESARLFHCPDAGISMFTKFENLQQRKHGRLMLALSHFLDNHPTNEQRIAYLREIASEQAPAEAQQ